MFDYLSDDEKSPKVLLVNCRLTDNQLTAGLGFFSMGIRKDKAFDLFDQRGVKVCRIELPRAGYMLPRDVALALSEEIFNVQEIYGY
jgi:hypothetical protein